jgi:tRNA dimethylallyltransferase
LYARIEARCEEMLQRGFLDEVQELDRRGLRFNSSAAGAIGYRQALQFFDSPQSERDRSDFVAAFKRASRHYAKRQFTWFRKEPLFRWLNVEEHTPDRIRELILQDFEQW